MRKFLTTYGKTIAAVIGAAAYAVQAPISDGHITGTEWTGIVVTVLVAAGVWQAPAITRASASK